MLYVNPLSNVSKLFRNGHFFYSQPISVAIFVTIAMVKVKLIPDCYTWAIVLISHYEENGENRKYYFLASKGTKNAS